MVEVFPKCGGNYRVEPDASSGSYFWGASWILCAAADDATYKVRAEIADALGVMLGHLPQVSVSNWPRSGLQIDADFTKLLFAHEPQLESSTSFFFGYAPSQM